VSTSIDQAFIQQWESEVKVAFQRQGSLLRNFVRRKDGVRGSSTHFPTVGKGVAGTKARQGLVPTMNVSHATVTCTLVDIYAGDWIDKLDELKTNIDERKVLTDAGAYALGRKADDQIITALAAGTNTTGALTLTSGATIRNGFLTTVGALHARDVPADGRVFGAVSWEIWEAMMTIDQFVRSDYVGDSLPYKTVFPIKNWLGVNWTPHTGLPKSGNVRTGFVWHADSVGQAVGVDITSDMQWVLPRASTFVANWMSMGAALIDTIGVQKFTVDESTALPST
jgi:hypothetical protein